MTGLHDHPLRADCSTCRFAGNDGDFGHIKTCDAMPEQRDDDALFAEIDRWVRGGEIGPCPGWQPGPLCDEQSIDAWLEAQEMRAAEVLT